MKIKFVLLIAMVILYVVGDDHFIHTDHHRRRKHRVASGKRDIRYDWRTREFISGQRRNSKLDSGLNAISTDPENEKNVEKLFLSPNYTIVQAQIGTTAVLHCEVIDIGESTVSWIRRRDYHLLTVGLQTYSSDKRFFTSNGKSGQDWSLHIRYSELKDSGLYECQITTHPASSLFVELQLLEDEEDVDDAHGKEL
ncbi:uncharacterized protein LOC116161903 isoform X3 [Photinus pyralis]|uniref:uncharacterized protein LOC116161903 isoform X3 n=1 Tax=Photinus pyralis TaxID=7054 RepID=UPI0012675C8D|nr:uncharacterized protein LOC116161903 isoform X3 [Photinus pyralis]